MTLRTYLVYNTVVGLLVVAGNSFQNENTFLQKNLIGLLYYDPIAYVCIYLEVQFHVKLDTCVGLWCD